MRPGCGWWRDLPRGKLCLRFWRNLPRGKLRAGRKALDQRQLLGLREAACQQLRDLGLALPSRLLQQLVDVPFIEMWREQADPAEVKPSIRDRLEQHGE